MLHFSCAGDSEFRLVFVYCWCLHAQLGATPLPVDQHLRRRLLVLISRRLLLSVHHSRWSSIAESAGVVAHPSPSRRVALIAEPRFGAVAELRIGRLSHPILVAVKSAR